MKSKKFLAEEEVSDVFLNNVFKHVCERFAHTILLTLLARESALQRYFLSQIF